MGRAQREREREDDSGINVLTAGTTLPLSRKKKTEYRQVAFCYINIHDSYKICKIEQ